MTDRRFIGKSYEDMERILTVLCELEDDTVLTEEEQAAMGMAIQCVTEVMNRMVDDRRIEWDDPE